MPWKLVLVCSGCGQELDEGAGLFVLDAEQGKGRLLERATELGWATYDRNWHCRQCLRMLGDLRPPVRRIRPR